MSNYFSLKFKLNPTRRSGRWLAAGGMNTGERSWNVPYFLHDTLCGSMTYSQFEEKAAASGSRRARNLLCERSPNILVSGRRGATRRPLKRSIELQSHESERARDDDHGQDRQSVPKVLFGPSIWLACWNDVAEHDTGYKATGVRGVVYARHHYAEDSDVDDPLPQLTSVVLPQRP